MKKSQFPLFVLQNSIRTTRNKPWPVAFHDEKATGHGYFMRQTAHETKS